MKGNRGLVIGSVRAKKPADAAGALQAAVRSRPRV